MPTRQTTKTPSSDSPSQQLQQSSSNSGNNNVSSNNNNNNNNNNVPSNVCDNNINLVLETTGYVQRMRMPSGALRDVDELVNEIKLNLRLKGNTNNSSTSETIRNCCCENAEEELVEGRGGSSLLSVGGGKVKSSRAFGGLNRIQGAPYYVHRVNNNCQHCCSTSTTQDEAGNHLTALESWQRRHHVKQQQQSSDDPYELLQELLKEGGLIKEAVRRINYLGDEQVKCFDYEKDDYESSSALITFLPTV